MRLRSFLIVPVIFCVSPAVAHAQSTPTWTEIGPLFAKHCALCHSGADAPLGLRLDSLEGALRGSTNGPVMVSGNPAGSELVRRIRGQSQPRMPLTGPPFLSAAEIALVERWVEAGLPAGAMPTPVAKPEAPRPGPDDEATFAHVAPILLKRCVKCHKNNGKMGAPPEGLRLDTYANVMALGERLAVLPGKPGLSELVRRIEGKSSPRMPMDGPPWLSDDDVRLIRQWITQGAPNADGKPARIPVGARVRFRGILTGQWAIDGAPFTVDRATRIRKRPSVGGRAEVRGVVTPEGGVRATRLRRR